MPVLKSASTAVATADIVADMNNQNNPKPASTPRKRGRPSSSTNEAASKRTRRSATPADVTTTIAMGSPESAAKDRHKDDQTSYGSRSRGTRLWSEPPRSTNPGLAPISKSKQPAKSPNKPVPKAKAIKSAKAAPTTRMLKSKQKDHPESPLKKHGRQEPEKNVSTNLEDAFREKPRRKPRDTGTFNKQSKAISSSTSTRKLRGSAAGQAAGSNDHDEGQIVNAEPHVSKLRHRRSKGVSAAATEADGANEVTENIPEDPSRDHDNVRRESGDESPDSGSGNDGDENDDREGHMGDEADEELLEEGEGEVLATVPNVHASASANESVPAEKPSSPQASGKPRRKRMAAMQTEIDETTDDPISTHEEAAAFLQCHSFWKNITEASTLELELESPDVYTQLGKEARAAEKDLLRLYGIVSKINRSALPAHRKNLEDAFENLEDSYEAIVAISKRHANFAFAGTDLFEHLIPSLAMVTWSAVATFYQEGKIDLQGFHFVIPLLQLIVDVMRSAKNKWTGAVQVFQSGVRQRVNRISSGFKQILARYTKHFEQTRYSQNARQYLDQYTNKRQQDLMELDDFLKERRELIQKQVKRYLYPPDQTQTATESAHRREIVDVDITADWETDDGESIVVSDEHEISESSEEESEHHAVTGLPTNNVQLRREPTAEIPGPSPVPWSDKESAALIQGLRMFTGSNRFQHILDAYGSQADALHGRDLDELMLQARFIKQSMALPMKENPSRSWDWLASVPG